MRFHHQIIIILLLILSYSSVAYAKRDFSICKPFGDIAPQRPFVSTPVGEDYIRLFADQATVQEKIGTSTFSGDVWIQRAEQFLRTPVVIYDYNKEVVDAEGNFIFWDNRFVISGSKIRLYQENQGEMDNAHYWLLSRRARGHAEKIIRESKYVAKFERATYTTCAPNKEVWRLQASQLTLDEVKSKGTARHVTIHLLNIPFFYTPYLSFPLDDNPQSGLLAPHFGSSDETGIEFSLPYYFYLSPHYDATVTPRMMSRRGLLWKTEFRYLTQVTDGQLKWEYLPHDTSRGERRNSVVFKHSGQLKGPWSTDIDINYASDERFFEELGNNISVASITHLERRGDLRYSSKNWKGLLRLQTFQTLDAAPSSRPYQRVPQLVLKTAELEKNRRLNMDLQTEFVRFERDTNVIEGPIGDRVDIKSIFSFPWRTPGTFFVPKLSLLYTHYDLSHVGAGEKTTYKRSLFRFSTDTGLFLDRDINMFNRSFVQTLEPRLFYRYTPYRDQSDIPIFDTAKYDLSFLQLFREDSFNGPDRVDDGHQATIALTSRLLGTQTGIEHIRASVGQIYYFQDRRVTLPTQPIETDLSSNIIMELAAQFAKDWRASSTLRWNPHTRNTEHTVMQVRYHSDSEHILNMSYRLRDDSIEQLDTSFYWSLGRRWIMLGRWNYSLPSQKVLDTFAGIEYHSCCWAVRAIARRYLNSIEGDLYLTGLFLQFQLKGLGAIGKKTDSFLEEHIQGYYDHF